MKCFPGFPPDIDVCCAMCKNNEDDLQLPKTGPYVLCGTCRKLDVPIGINDPSTILIARLLINCTRLILKEIKYNREYLAQ